MTNSTLAIALRNNTDSGNVFAYITGHSLSNNSFVLIQADGKTPYFPESPSEVGTPLAVDCGIQLGPPGSTTSVTIPQIAAGRIWFCVDDTLTFLLNPGPGLVEPSVSNPSDPNYSKNWGFCEFTFNEWQLFANISYVDFVSLPIALTLQTVPGMQPQHVTGVPANGLGIICKKLVDQHVTEGAPWDRLIVRSKDGIVLRVLSPNTALVMDTSLFDGYYDEHVRAVWDKYSAEPLILDTQNTWGEIKGHVVNGLFIFPGVGTFSPPSAADIFSCSTGPFAQSHSNTAEMGNIAARLAAAFNRSTLLIDSHQPTGEHPDIFYRSSPTNHFSRIVHETNTDGRGYAFPYDDVGPWGGQDLAGTVSDGNPSLFTVTVGAM